MPKFHERPQSSASSRRSQRRPNSHPSTNFSRRDVQPFRRRITGSKVLGYLLTGPKEGTLIVRRLQDYDDKFPYFDKVYNEIRRQQCMPRRADHDAVVDLYNSRYAVNGVKTASKPVACVAWSAQLEEGLDIVLGTRRLDGKGIEGDLVLLDVYETERGLVAANIESITDQIRRREDSAYRNRFLEQCRRRLAEHEAAENEINLKAFRVAKSLREAQAKLDDPCSRSEEERARKDVELLTKHLKRCDRLRITELRAQESLLYYEFPPSSGTTFPTGERRLALLYEVQRKIDRMLGNSKESTMPSILSTSGAHREYSSSHLPPARPPPSRRDSQRERPGEAAYVPIPVRGYNTHRPSNNHGAQDRDSIPNEGSRRELRAPLRYSNEPGSYGAQSQTRPSLYKRQTSRFGSFVGTAQSGQPQGPIEFDPPLRHVRPPMPRRDSGRSERKIRRDMRRSKRDMRRSQRERRGLGHWSDGADDYPSDTRTMYDAPAPGLLRRSKSFRDDTGAKVTTEQISGPGHSEIRTTKTFVGGGTTMRRSQSFRL